MTLPTIHLYPQSGSEAIKSEKNRKIWKFYRKYMLKLLIYLVLTKKIVTSVT